MAETNLPKPNPKEMTSFQKKRIMEHLGTIFGHSRANEEMKMKVYRGLIGDYTEDDIREIEEENAKLIEQINKEMEHHTCIGIEPSQFISPHNVNDGTGCDAV